MESTFPELSGDYWVTSFEITNSDLDRLEQYIDEGKRIVTIIELARRIIRGRLRFGHDISRSAISMWAGKPTTRLWNPAENWDIGDNVIVVRNNTSDILDTFVGEIIKVEDDMVSVQLENITVRFQRAKPGSDNALKWHNIVREIVAQKMLSTEIDDRVTGIVAQFGDRIISLLNEVLEKADRFIGYKNNWYLSKFINTYNRDVTETIFRLLISQTKPYTTEEILTKVESNSNDIAGGLRLNKTLLQYPDKFQNIGTISSPIWKVNIQEAGKTSTGKYAYDPKTYEIICYPNETITAKTYQKLQELKLLEHVIAF